MSILQGTVHVLPHGRLTRREAARYLGRSVKTLEAWSRQGIGPRAVKDGMGRALYELEDLDRFVVGEGHA
jgi:hypothetical protein